MRFQLATKIREELGKSFSSKGFKVNLKLGLIDLVHDWFNFHGVWWTGFIVGEGMGLQMSFKSGSITFLFCCKLKFSSLLSICANTSSFNKV